MLFVKFRVFTSFPRPLNLQFNTYQLFSLFFLKQLKDEDVPCYLFLFPYFNCFA